MTRVLLNVAWCVISQVVIKIDGSKRGEPSGQLRKVTAICRPEGLKEVGEPLKDNLVLNYS